MKRGIIAFAIIALFAHCAKVPITGRRQLKLIKSSQMQALSFSQYSEVKASSKLVPDSDPRTKMVKEVGAKISSAVNRFLTNNGYKDRLSEFQWEFNLTEENTVNAWCMPGGKVVVYTGILPITKTEEGLAVVMGHEIAHAIARHGNERMSQGMISQGITTGVGVALRDKPEAMQSLFVGAIGAGAGVGMLAFGRNQESEADQLGMVFMAMAGYQPEEAIPFWERMKAVGGGDGTPEFMRTHPSNDIRIERIKEYLPIAESYYSKQ